MLGIDFKRLRGMISLADVLNLLGRAKFGLDSNIIRGRCPFACNPDVRCCNYSCYRGVWYCHRCKRGGGALDLYMAHTGLGAYHAAMELCRLLDRPVPWMDREERRRLRKPRKRREAMAGEQEDVVE